MRNRKLWKRTICTHPHTSLTWNPHWVWKVQKVKHEIESDSEFLSVTMHVLSWSLHLRQQERSKNKTKDAFTWCHGIFGLITNHNLVQSLWTWLDVCWKKFSKETFKMKTETDETFDHLKRCHLPIHFVWKIICPLITFHQWNRQKMVNSQRLWTVFALLISLHFSHGVENSVFLRNAMFCWFLWSDWVTNWTYVSLEQNRGDQSLDCPASNQNGIRQQPKAHNSRKLNNMTI